MNIDGAISSGFCAKIENCGLIDNPSLFLPLSLSPVLVQTLVLRWDALSDTESSEDNRIGQNGCEWNEDQEVGESENIKLEGDPGTAHSCGGSRIDLRLEVDAQR